MTNIGSTSFKFQLLAMPEEKVVAKGAVERVGSSSAAARYQIIPAGDGGVGNGGAGNGGVGNGDVTAQTAAKVINIDTSIDTSGTGGGYLACISHMLGVLQSAGHSFQAVGFKTVHGGTLDEPVLVDDSVMSKMEDYSGVAPAHNPPYLAAMRAFRQKLPAMPLVAVFETWFHRDMPLPAKLYAVPYEWYEKYGVRRYGFHGASHRYVSQAVPRLLERERERQKVKGLEKDQRWEEGAGRAGRAGLADRAGRAGRAGLAGLAGMASLRIISCHLGGSSSICAIRNGVSVDTSMGFSPQSGLPMSNRCGELDPYVIRYIMQKTGMDFEQVLQVLAEKSGLLGISGISGDVRDLLAARDKEPRAAAALDFLLYEVRKYIGAFAAAMNGVDAIAFTGGIGENDVELRRRLCKDLSFLGVELDEEKNASACGSRGLVDTIISAPTSQVDVVVIKANEELIVARETYRIVKAML
ncbi:MAG TPA: hypothetical protein GXX29_11670 [Firmicutes bacterium]|nr:hypothetical protein [Bacillota bacterium]